jgi:drug/metabolite transporter (DMT)-like permease
VTGLSSVGLALAALTAVFASFVDVTIKLAVRNANVTAVMFWSRLVGAALMAVVFFFWVRSGHFAGIRDGGTLFNIPALHFSPVVTFAIYTIVEGVLLVGSALLQGAAYQKAQLSAAAPYISLTPVFLIFTGWLFLGERPAIEKLVGVLVIVLGSFGMHRQLFAKGFAAPFIAIFREVGPRYMVFVALILALTNPIDQRLVLMSDPVTQSCTYMVAQALMLSSLSLREPAAFAQTLRRNWLWIVALGVVVVLALLTQFTTHDFIPVVITISIKRASIMLTLLWSVLFFKEKAVAERAIASLVMLAGVFLIYLDVPLWWAIGIAAIVATAFITYLSGARDVTPVVELPS